MMMGGETEKVEAVGIIYAEYYEGPRRNILVYYYPIDEAFTKLEKETGLNLVLDDRDHGNTSSWPYVIVGGGRSMFGLH